MPERRDGLLWQSQVSLKQTSACHFGSGRANHHFDRCFPGHLPCFVIDVRANRSMLGFSAHGIEETELDVSVRPGYNPGGGLGVMADEHVPNRRAASHHATPVHPDR